MYKDRETVTETVRSLCNDAVISVEKQRGLPFLVKRCKKRAGLYAGAVIGAIILTLSSFFIWDLRVEGNTYVDDADIRKTLQSLGIAEGEFKKTDDLEKLYNSFLLAEKRISWISVNYDGTVAHVEVNEAKQVPEKRDRTKNINIIARCDGIVRRVDALDGSGEVAAGETVTKGQLLISSFIETRKTGVVMQAARGSVWASTVQNYDIYIPKTASEKRYTDKTSVRRYIRILGRKLPLSFTGAPSFRKYDKETGEAPCVLPGGARLPFYIFTETAREYTGKQQMIDQEKAAAKAAAELSVRIETDLAQAEILRREESVSETENGYLFHYELSCLENIARPVEFDFEP